MGGEGSDYEAEEIDVRIIVDDEEAGPGRVNVQEGLAAEVMYYFQDGKWYSELNSQAYAAQGFPQHIPKPPDNKSKNQLEASTKEVAGGSHKTADLKELESFHRNGALGARVLHVTPEVKRFTMTAGWRRTWKGEGDNRVAKSRLYVRGFHDKRDKEWLKTYSSTMDKGLFRILLIYVMSRGWNLAKTDVSTAFLQAKSVDELYIRLPKDLPHEARDMGYEPEGVYKQERALYGRVDAPRLFTTQFKSALQLHGWGEVAPSILVKRDVKGEIEGVMGTHVDDLLCGAATPCAELEAIGKVYKTGDVYAIRQDVYEVYAGLDIMVGKDRCLLGQHRYAEGINTELNTCDTLRRRQFTDSDILLTPDGEVQHNIQRSAARMDWDPRMAGTDSATVECNIL